MTPMPVTRRDFWLGLGAIVLAVTLHALFPRYEWRQVDGAAWARHDRWTGDLRFGTFQQTETGVRWAAK